jgi:hypothetical protein
MKEYLIKIKLLCDINNVKIAIVNFPSGYQLDFKKDDWLIQNDMTIFCNENGIPFLDLTPLFLEHKEDKDLFVVDNQHPGQKGNKIAAKEIFEFLINNRLVLIR